MFTEQATTSEVATSIERLGWRLYRVGVIEVDLHGWQCGCGGTADHECQHIQQALAWADHQLQAEARCSNVSRHEADGYYNGAYHRLHAESFGW